LGIVNIVYIFVLPNKLNIIITIKEYVNVSNNKKYQCINDGI